MTLPRRFALIALPAVLALAACGQVPTTSSSPNASATASPAPSGSTAGTPSATPSGSAPAGSGTGTCEYTPSGDASKPVQLPPTTGVEESGTVTYALTLSAGVVKIKMDRSKAPCTINSFISLAEQGFFDKTKCHRLADSGFFFLQCGDPNATGRGGPGYQFADETDGTETYDGGVVAMANAGPGTNGSQFFLVWDNTPLKPNYTVFGTMDEASRAVVAGIASQGQDGSNPDGTGVPNAPADIKTVKKA